MDNTFLDFTEHLLNDKKPSIYFEIIFSDTKLSNEYPFKMLNDLKEVPQNLKYHPEGSVWNHTMLVIDRAAEVRKESKHEKSFMWAALLHDLGKKPTTRMKKGRIVSYDHDKVGKDLAIEFLKVLTKDDDLIKKVGALVRWHMSALFVVKDLPFGDLQSLVKEVPIDEIALLTISDRMGRGDMTEEKVMEENENIKIFIKKCNEVKEKL
ncbi:HDIG domain-containing protein [Clostridium grantii DSM 8605]|uniref:HDIG domain-containing protein n=2 Tax=Clostridium TaxID=1485 RepID=A0A1M5XCV0_9CLOT|nr:HDIG domain-containing metalloprotein [Clostridium grantii]SHH97675.1 HDIG domain-containing protein [Clostridium grantii DSM 8605]